MFTFKKINFNDKDTYHLIGMGLTKGIFQLEEAHLGGRYSQIIKPKTIEEIADIISIIRPACKEAKHTDGKTSMTDAYCKIHNKEMEPTYLHEDLKPILSKTNSVLIYQEQVIEICRNIAGMTLADGDQIRRAIGKKLPEEMKKWKDKFVSGCINNKYEKELAEKLWEWIENAAGYGFNKSHAIAYAVTAYKTAYAKCHFPTYFYLAMLKYADNKTDTFQEMLDLINDAKLFGIKVIPPVITEANADFKTLNNSTITYGIKYIKGIGSISIKSIMRIKDAATWEEFLFLSNRYKLDKTACEALIKTGTLDVYGIPRTRLIREYEIFRELTDTETAIVLSLISGNLHSSILVEIDNTDFSNKRNITKYQKVAKTGIFSLCGKYGGLKSVTLEDRPTNKMKFIEAIDRLVESEVPNATRRNILTKMTFEYKNTNFEKNIGLYSLWEKHYFGIPLTNNDKGLVVSPDVIPCINVINLLNDEKAKIAGIIEEVSFTKIRRGDSAGKEMAFIDLADNSYILKGVMVFSELLEKSKPILQKGMPVSIFGKKMRNGNSLVAMGIKKL